MKHTTVTHRYVSHQEPSSMRDLEFRKLSPFLAVDRQEGANTCSLTLVCGYGNKALSYHLATRDDIKALTDVLIEVLKDWDVQDHTS